MDWMDSKGIEYVEMDATKEPDMSTVPVTIIGDERIVGFDRPAIKRAIKKYDS
jgi:glutaredoxin